MLQQYAILTLHVFDNFSVLLQFEAPFQLIYLRFKRTYFAGTVSCFQFKASYFFIFLQGLPLQVEVLLVLLSDLDR